MLLALLMRLRIHWLYPLQRANTLRKEKKGDFGMTLNAMWWWDSTSGDLRSVLHFFIGITLRSILTSCSVGWGCGIHWLLLSRGIRPIPNDCPAYDTKQSDGEAPVMREPWGMRSISSLPSLPDPLWPGVVAPDRVLFIGPIEQNLSTYAKRNCLKCSCLWLWNYVLMQNRTVWNRIVLTFTRTFLTSNCV